MKNSALMIIVFIPFFLLCSEEPNAEGFVFKGWLLNKDFFGNLEKIEYRKKEVDKDYVVIKKSFNSLAYTQREIDPRAIAFIQRLNAPIEDDEK